MTSSTALGPLRAEHWPAGAYDRTRLPERVLQFGTGMLLRALVDAAVDVANQSGAFRGSILVVQSTPHGNAAVLNRQSGLFTLVERGLVDGKPVQRTRLIGAISRALRADAEWPAVREAVVRPELQVIVSNVTEAGFRLESQDLERPEHRASFPAKLVDLLHTRFDRLPNGPPLYVIPTELVPDNGPELAAMVGRLASCLPRARDFRAWLSQRVRFCSSLVDRITTGAPDPDLRRDLESRLGYTDGLCTVTEPHALWAIEADPAPLRTVFPIEGVPGVIVAPDITLYRERKLRLLNGTHTATAPLAVLANVMTVREAAEHPGLGAFIRRILFEEIPAGTDLPAETAAAYARTVLDRFRNPWLAHEWRVIATNQTAKFRLRVAPCIVGFVTRRRAVPQALALSCAALLRFARNLGNPGATEATGWWRGRTYSIADADLPTVTRHWRAVEPSPARAPIPADALRQLAARALADSTVVGSDLTGLSGFLEAVTTWLLRLEREGVETVLDTLARSDSR